MSTVPLPEYCSADSAVTVFQKGRRALATATEIPMWHGMWVVAPTGFEPALPP